MVDVKERAPDTRLYAWILDDRPDQQRKIADILLAIGIEADREGDIEAIGDRVDNVISGLARRPDLIFIDQHWEIELTNLDVIGRRDITIESPRSVGIALGTFLEAVEELEDPTLVMTSINEDEVSNPVHGLRHAISVPKSEINKLLRKSSESASDALERLGIGPVSDVYISGSVKFLKSLTGAFALGDEAVADLLGSRAGSGDAESIARQLLRVSRDSRARVRLLLKIMTHLHETYGAVMPSADEVAGDLRLPFRKFLVRGTFEDLLRISAELEWRAGGATDDR
jgi:hypothetical protein